MTVVRQPAVAGRFYPDDPAQLRAEVRRYLDAGRAQALEPDSQSPAPLPLPKAIIVPHAGYVYSGPVAGSGYAGWKELRSTVRRVVLLGPAHFVQFRGLAASSADVFETPLGPVPVDTAAISELLALPQVRSIDEAHAREHSLEVHLPFLQETLGEFRVVPLAIGQATPDEVAEVLEKVWDGPQTLIVVSSDLSHYHPYETAKSLDAETSRTIEQGRVADLRAEGACGFLGIGGLLQVAAKRGLRARAIDLRNSGDTAGPRDRVVGYGAYVLEPAGESDPAVTAVEGTTAEECPGGSESPGHSASAAESSQPSFSELTPDEERLLLAVAGEAIQRGLAYGMKPETIAADFPPALQSARATFVTLTRGGQLRGCMGTLEAMRPLVSDVAHNSYSAAFLDPRFPPLTFVEADNLETHISILGLPEPIPFESEDDLLSQLRPGIDGVTLYDSNRRGTLLPAVWKKIPDRRKFFQTVKQKAGFAPDYWSATLRVERYTTTTIGHGA